jgi:hypothetical protein
MAPYRLSFHDAHLLKSQLQALSRSYEGGGMQAVSTPTGQAPQPGSGRRFASQLQYNARKLAGAVGNAIRRDTTALDPELAQAWRQTDHAYQVGQAARQLETWMSKPGILDPQTQTYNGKALLNLLQSKEARHDLAALRQNYGRGFVEMLREFAQTLAVLDTRHDPFRPRIGHHLINYAVRLPAGVMAGTGHMLEGAAMLLIPEALAMTFQQKPLAKLLFRGLTAPAWSKEGWNALGKVAGVLHAQGMDIPQMPAQPDHPSAVPSSDPRAARALDFYRQRLASPGVTKAQMEQFWRQQVSSATDPIVQEAFRQAYRERFGVEPGAHE